MRSKDLTKGDVCVPVEEYVTSNYSKFSRMVGNRQVYDIHVARLVRAFRIKRIELPILINEKGEICDGQTRLKACEALQIPVRYRVILGLTLGDVQILNSNTRPWKLGDFLDSYCEFGRPSYRSVKGMWERFPEFSLGSILMFLSNQSKTPHEAFRRGCFEVKSLTIAESWVNEIQSLRVYYDGYHKRDFVQAILRAVATGEFLFESFKSQLDKVPPRLYLRDCATAKDFLRLIEDVYNFQRKKTVRFF